MASFYAFKAITKLKGAYKAKSRTHFWRSDHNPIFLKPIYKQKLKRYALDTRVWSETDELKLKGTEWDVYQLLQRISAHAQNISYHRGPFAHIQIRNHG